MNPSDERLQAGIAAYKQGQKEEARRFIKQAIHLNPKNERAWLWLSGFVDSDEQRRYCFNQVLAINPDNQVARRGLAKFTAEPPPPVQPPTPPEPPPSPKPLPAPPTAEINEPLALLEEEERGGNRLPIIFGLLIVLLIIIGLAAVLAFPDLTAQLLQGNISQASAQPYTPEEETAVLQTIYENIAATNSENIDRYMATIHSQSPGYQQTQDKLEVLYEEFDLTAVISSLELISYSPEEARVRFVLETRKRSGPDFRDNQKRGIFILRPEDGRWKLYDQEINRVDYLN